MTYQIPETPTGLRFSETPRLSTHPDFWVRGEENAETAYNLSLVAFADAVEVEVQIATTAERMVRMRNAVAGAEKSRKPSESLARLTKQANYWIDQRRAATHASARAWHYSKNLAALWMQRRSWRVHHGPAARAALSSPKSRR